MKSFPRLLLLLLALTGLAGARTAVAGNVYFVAPSGGSDANPGTIGQPLASLANALARVAPGDTIYLRGGTYELTARLTLSRQGTDAARYHLWAYRSEAVVVDFAKAGAGSSARGFSISGRYWHLKGFTVQNAGDNGVYVSGAYNVLERLTARFNGDTGIHLADGASYNLIVNCDSYRNYDAATLGENADGFAAKFGVGPGNVFRGTRAWQNADDGYDFWRAGQNDAGAPTGGAVRVEDAYAYRNGYNPVDGTRSQGDGNGFKLGEGLGAHVLVRCVAFDNPRNGFDYNRNSEGTTLYNVTAFRNGGQNFRYDPTTNTSAFKVRNSISFGGGTVNVASAVQASNNSWNGLTATAADFVSLDTSLVTGPRLTDGRMPASDFLRLVPTSRLVDAGTDVGLPFAGAAPDLGAFERGLTNTGVEATNVLAASITVFPNPARASATIAYALPDAGHTRITVYDAVGRRVAAVLDEVRPAGAQAARWTPAGLPAGLYLVRIETPAGVATQALALLN
ncbi:MAG TPA: right-handed parallel beta-helix repeat-containing protein [Rhodothermales bacterium]|nr:right-handed parallel beta-helix repeat-containing protein [Rhodothermales bacterium]